MLPESIAHVPTAPGMLLWFSGDLHRLYHPTVDSTLVQILLRELHFLAGITWIGILYFFNLVNVPLMKKLDAPTKGKVIPELMPRALWWFRWGAVFTVLSGLIYYAMYIVATDAHNALATENATFNVWAALGEWVVIVLIAYAIVYAVIQPASGPLNKGVVFAPVVSIVALGMAIAVMIVLGNMPGVSNAMISIGIGGGLGIMMFLNVWLIIWPAQKKIIAWTEANAKDGTPIPPESAKLGRRGFMASRTNTWLSIFMLFFMGAAHHYAMFGK